MDQHTFSNQIKSLFNIDGYQLPELSDDHKSQFLRDPVHYFMRAEEVQQEAIYREVMKRQA